MSLQVNLILRLDWVGDNPLLKALLSKLWLQHRLQISVCPLNLFFLCPDIVSNVLLSCVITELFCECASIDLDIYTVCLGC